MLRFSIAPANESMEGRRSGRGATEKRKSGGPEAARRRVDGGAAVERRRVARGSFFETPPMVLVIFQRCRSPSKKNDHKM